MKDRFKNLKGKKVLLYGTGNIAEKILKEQHDFQVVAVLDQFKVSGCFFGISIIEWNDVEAYDVHDIIIATSDVFYLEIFKRIIYACKYRDINIWGANGKNLNELYETQKYSISEASYFEKNMDELKEKIQLHDAISFDIFDTLIMRDVLEPLDIFDIVQTQVDDMGIQLSDFRKFRRTAELHSAGRDINAIYEILQQMTKISDCELSRIMQCEIQCEKRHLMRREVICELLQHALNIGKKVYLISDMYITSEILSDILANLGIKGYEKIYVSCEYGVSKTTGLFDVYLDEVKSDSYLHIGDNHHCDYLAAKKAGIDAFEIKSAYELLKISNISSSLVYANSMVERKMIGATIAQLLNNPFALYRTSGVVRLGSIKELAECFVAPLTLVYMSRLFSVCEKNMYDGVIFVSRDGYLFKQIYDSARKENPQLPESYYVYASRKLFCGLDAITERNYLQYLIDMGIDVGDGAYLVCDLLTHGTAIKGFHALLKGSVEGFCLSLLTSVRNIKIYDVYKDYEWGEMLYSTVLVENFYTSPQPSLDSINEEGTLIFAKEYREEDKIQLLEKLHMYVKLYCRNKWKNGEDLSRYAKKMFELLQFVRFEGELRNMHLFELRDDITGNLISLEEVFGS